MRDDEGSGISAQRAAACGRVRRGGFPWIGGVAQPAVMGCRDNVRCQLEEQRACR